MANQPQLSQSPYLHLDAGYTQAFDYDSNGNVIYQGWAVPQTADKAQAVWRIAKYIYAVIGDSNIHCTDIQWANGQETFKNIWNNRASLSFQ